MNHQAHRSVCPSLLACLLLATGALLLVVPAAFARSRPVIDRELTAEVGVSEAKLGALVDPGSLDTSYHFEYGTTPAYGQSTPYPIGDAGTGATPSTVWAAASGLQPGTTYHYRIIASNEIATVKGADQTFTTETAEQASCPNEQLRIGFSASLPDCRAYEQVTVPNKDSAEPDDEDATSNKQNELNDNFAAREGDRLSYHTEDLLPESTSGFSQYLATRGPNGWSSESTVPNSDYYAVECDEILNDEGKGIEVYSADMSDAILAYGGLEVPGGEYGTFGTKIGANKCSGPDPELVSGEPQQVVNLFVRDNENGTYQLVNQAPPGVTPTNAYLAGASEDDSHVVFRELARLTPDAPGGVEDLYEWDEGVVRLVTVLPDGDPTVGSIVGASSERGSGAETHAVSADGSRVFFTAGDDLYVRENAEQSPSEECAGPAEACTFQVDASQIGGSDGGGDFYAASADGSRVFFTDEARLTSDSTAQAGKPDLYEYDLEAAPSARLADLTANPAESADVLGVPGVSDDGSSVYFAATGVLAANENANKEKAQTGQANLYVRSDGATTFIATLALESCVWERNCGQASPDGAYFAFASAKSLTGYDNLDSSVGRPVREVFLYSKGSNGLACASCNPSGEAPSLPPASEVEMEYGGISHHYVTDSGRLFFETTQPLLPRDTNGQQDVYEFESDGVGSCGDAAGCVSLLSSGAGSGETIFIDASVSGDDVFMLNTQQLTPQDQQEGALNIVDARVDGGFPAPVFSSCTTVDSCRAAPAPQPSIFGAPASQTFSGTGNLAPAPAVKPKPKSKPAKCAKGFVRKKGRCVKANAAKRRAKKSAHAGRRGK